MRKVKVSLPVSVTDFGVGLNGLGLALNLHVNAEFVERSDDRFVVETSGEGAGHYPTGLRHPVVQGLSRVFQQLERAPTGVTVRVDSRIPPASGLGVEAAFLIAGIIGANNLCGGVLSRSDVLTLAAQATQPSHSASLLGGLTTSALTDDGALLYRSLPIAAWQALVVLPELDKYKPAPLPARVASGDVLHNLSRLPLLVQALGEGDTALLAHCTDDRLLAPLMTSAVPGFEHVAALVKRSGQTLIFSGGGPAFVILSLERPDTSASAIATAFASLSIKARTWIVPVDRQGVVLSVAQS